MKRVLNVSAIAYLAISVEYSKALVDESDVGLDEDAVISSLDSEIRETIRLLALENINRKANKNSLGILDIEIDEYDISVSDDIEYEV